MIINPRFVYKFVNNAVFLSAERKNIIITNLNFYNILLRISEGVVSEESLIEALKDDLSIPEILYHIDILKNNRIITDAYSGCPKNEAIFWEELSISPEKLYGTLEKNAVAIRTVNFKGSVDEFRLALDKTGIKVGTSAALDIVITDDYSSPELDDINKNYLKSGKSWIIIKPSGTSIWIGPLFIPGKTGCWECLRQRISLNKNIYAFSMEPKRAEVSNRIFPSISMGVQIAANIASLEIAKFFYYGESKSLDGKLLSFDALDLSIQNHILIKRPQCVICGDSSLIGQIQDEPVLLDKDEQIVISHDGGLRTDTPENVIKKYEIHVSPIIGIIQKVEQIFDSGRSDSPVFNYYSGVNSAFRNTNLPLLSTHVRSFSGGKGSNHVQAKAGAICEAIERYSCLYSGEEKVIKATYIELGQKAIHPYSCLNFSKSQYEMREQLNAECKKEYFLIPNEFNDNETIDWAKVFMLGSNEYKYLPANYCYYQYPLEDESKRFCYSDSNGCASGNTIEEAILQGLLELIERDSVAIWWYNMLNRPEVDIKSFNSSYFNQLITYYNSMGRSLYAIDLIFDLGIPCFAAISLDQNGERPLVGYGAHVDAKIALERALVELNQFLPMLYDSRYTSDPSIAHWIETATVENKPYLVPTIETKKMRDDYVYNGELTIVNSIKHCQKRLASKNLDIYFLNMTKPDIGLSVAKVIVPGMRHFWKRLGSGRLYDVPVKMGLMKVSKHENDMNPLSMFF